MAVLHRLTWVVVVCLLDKDHSHMLVYHLNCLIEAIQMVHQQMTVNINLQIKYKL